jgi:hypothetical protein
MAYYKAVLNGSYEGQEVVNILWYRAVQTVGGQLLAPASGEDVAFQVEAEVVPEWLGIHPAGYTLVDITVYAYDDNLQLAFSQPHTRQVGDVGLLGGDTFGPAGVSIWRMNIANLPAVNVLYPRETALLGPKRGYLAVGPVPAADVDEAGLLTSTALASVHYANARAALAETLENLSPVAFFVPVRASYTTIAGLITLQGFGQVQSVTTRPAVSWRRSRMPNS